MDMDRGGLEKLHVLSGVLRIALPVVVLFMAVAGIPLDTFGAVDKWGGDSRLRHPNAHYQTGTCTLTSEWTITDVNKKWQVDELKGSILQPDTSKEIYFLIKGSTASQVEVYGSTNDADEFRSYLSVNMVSAPGVQYAILDQWRVDKVNSRWSLFDPYGNIFYIKSVNAFNYEQGRNGYDVSGKSFIDNMISKNGGADMHAAIVPELDAVKRIGFNTLGEIVNLAKNVPGAGAKTPALTLERYMPFIAQVRINALSLETTSSFVVNGVKCFDSNSDAFQTELEAHLVSEIGAKADGITAFLGHTSWKSDYLTPYRNAKYNIAANPWYIGLDWDEEPAYLRSEHANEHLGYRVMTSAAGTPRKMRAISLLQSTYGSIAALNAAWGTNYTGWEALEIDTGSGGINDALTKEPYCRDFGFYLESNVTMRHDMDIIAADFWRTYCRKVHDALDNLIAVHKLNFGPGYHGWVGDSSVGWDGILSPAYLFKGSASEDKKTSYIDIIGIGDPMHGPLDSPADALKFVRSDLISMYEEIGRPFWHESVWITAEADSGVAHTGTIEALSPTVLTDSASDFDTAMNWPSAYQGVSSRIWLLINGDGPRDSWMYYAISATGALGSQLTVDAEIGPANKWVWSKTPDMTKVAGPGMQYRIVVSDVIPMVRSNRENIVFIPITQAERAAVYTGFLDGILNLRASNGDYFDVGFSHWVFFDYAWRNGYQEHRNFGFETIKGNLYDGTANIENGEIQNCGNFIGPVSSKLKSMYNEIIVLMGVPPNIVEPKGLRVSQ